MVKRKKPVKKKVKKKAKKPKKAKKKIPKKKPKKHKIVKKAKKGAKKVVKSKIVVKKKVVKKPKKIVKKLKKVDKKPKPAPKKLKIGLFQQIIDKFKKKREEKDKKAVEKEGKEEKGGEKGKEPKLPEIKHATKVILIEDLMLRNPISIDLKEPIITAFELIEQYKLPSIIIIKKGMPIGIIDENSILSFFSSFIHMEPGALEANKNKIEKLSRRPVSAAMTKIENFAKKTTPLEEAIKLMNTYDLDQLPVVEKNKLVGALLTEDVLTFIEKSVGEHKIIEKEVFETGIDKLFDLINVNKKIGSKEAAEKLKVSISEIEKWARILQDHGLIKIDFSKVGTINLIKKERDVF